jgi:hypothetical protein
MPLFKEKKPTEFNEAESVLEALRSRTNKKEKKPVKFTWKGLGNLVANFSPDLGVKYRRLKALTEETAKPEEKDYIDFFEDVEKGLYGIAENTAYSVGDLATTGIDAVAGTDLNEKITEAFEENKLDDPETLIGKATELIGTYTIGGGVAFKILNRVKKLATLRKGKALAAATVGKKTSDIAGKAGYMAGVFGATDFLVNEPDKRALFTKLEETEGLSGRERAAANFRNRLKFAAEGTLIGGGFSLLGKPLALGFKYGIFKPGAKVAGIGLKTVDKLVVQPASYLLSKDKVVIPTISKKLQQGSAYTLEQVVSPLLIGKLPFKTRLPKFEKWRMFSVNSKDELQRRVKKLDNVLAKFRSTGEQTARQYRLSTAAKQEIKAVNRTIEKYLEDIEKRAYNLAGGFLKHYDTTKPSPALRDKYLNDVLAYLKKEMPLDRLPQELRVSAKALDQELVKAKKSFSDLLPEGELKDFMVSNVQSYMRKSFAVFTNPEYAPKKEVFDDAVKYFTGVIKGNKDMTEAALKFVDKPTDAQRITEYAKTLTTKLLKDGRTNDLDPLQLLQRIGKKDLRLDKLIKTGEELPDAIKRLLGAEDDLKSSVLTTVNHAIVNTTNKKLADRLATLGLKEGWLHRSREAAIAKGVLDPYRIQAPQSLGLLNTRLNNLFGSAQLSQAIRGTPGALDAAIQNKAYRALLQFKVATQFGKTVLSPATQVRNVTSASLFPLMSGHIGGRASVTDSVKMVMDDIFGAGKDVTTPQLVKSIENKIRLGVLDENIVASELGAVLKEIKKGSVNTLDGLYNKLTNGRFFKGATRLYAGGDNLWKWYGHEYVKSQMRSTYKNVDGIARWTKEITGKEYDRFMPFTRTLKTYDDALDEAAAWYIRNTYPTYSKVPEAIKAIRKLPFGNFVSFPAEMIRTTFNVLNIGAKEIASSNEALRQIGYRRMIGASFTLGGAGTASLNLASAITGTTLEELEAYKRSFAAPWNKDSILLPMTKWKEGIGKAINFSYFSPYEVVQKPFSSLITEIEQGKLLQKDIDDRTLELFGAFMGPLIEPFVSEAIALERTSDVIPAGKLIGGRGGVTKTGSRVYSPTDSVSDKITKSFVHIVKGVEPGASTTARKIAKGVNQDLTRGGVPVNLRDELLALFSGIRIINVDAPRAYNYKLTEYNKNKRSVTVSEKFYSPENAQTRGGDVLVKEFRKIQDEGLLVQRQFYQVIQDALAMGVSTRTLRQANKGRLSNREFNAILRGKYTPINFSKSRMNKRVRDIQKAFPNEEIDRNFAYPARDLLRVIREYRGKSLKPVETTEREIEDQRSEVTPRPEPTRVSQLQTPPLPQTGAPIVSGTQTANVVNPLSGLTQTETALLSPEEQLIRQRIKRT